MSRRQLPKPEPPAVVAEPEPDTEPNPKTNPPAQPDTEPSAEPVENEPEVQPAAAEPIPEPEPKPIEPQLEVCETYKSQGTIKWPREITAIFWARAKRAGGDNGGRCDIEMTSGRKPKRKKDRRKAGRFNKSRKAGRLQNPDSPGLVVAPSLQLNILIGENCQAAFRRLKVFIKQPQQYASGREESGCRQIISNIKATSYFNYSRSQPKITCEIGEYTQQHEAKNWGGSEGWPAEFDRRLWDSLTTEQKIDWNPYNCADVSLIRAGTGQCFE